MRRCRTLELTILGTAAGRPLKGRNVTAIALRMPPSRGTIWLFDCGEGTQHQIMRTGLKLSKLEHIFVTHLHGDHTFGLPGLLSSRAFAGGQSKVTLFGPLGLRAYIETSLTLTETSLNYELEIIEIDDGGIIFEDEGFIVEASPLEHRIACYGYRVIEKPVTGKLDTGKLAALGVPPGPLFGKLKRGEDIALADGRVIRAEEVIAAPLPGRIMTVLGDTSPCENAVRLALGADVVVHEATFEAQLHEKALEYGHSTSVQAAATAVKSGAARLILTHYSSRYRDEDVARLEEEAKALFPKTVAAFDLLTFHIPRRMTEHHGEKAVPLQ